MPNSITHYTNVQSTAPIILPLEINVDTVYVRSNITDIHDEEHPILWQYDEIQMSVTEYLKQTVPENQKISDTSLAELCQMFAEYQMQVDMALAELIALVAGGNTNV